MKRKRRNFLLLELLIAMTLASLFMLPIIRTPLNSLYNQQIELLKIDLVREAECTMALVKEKIATHQIDKIPCSYEPKIIKLHKHPFKREILLSVIHDKEGENGQKWRLLRVTISFTSLQCPKKLKSTLTQKLFVDEKS